MANSGKASSKQWLDRFRCFREPPQQRFEPLEPRAAWSYAIRMFHPEEVIFAPTGRCNLACAPLPRPPRPEELSVDEATAFLDTCADGGIERVGFSGGEPFLRLDFIVNSLESRRRSRIVLRPADDERRLVGGRTGSQCGAGRCFRGRFRRSHRPELGCVPWSGPDRISSFIRAVFDVWGRRDSVEILSVRSSDDLSFLRDMEAVASGLGGQIEKIEGEPSRIVDGTFLSRAESDPDDGKGLNIQVQRFPRSRSAVEGDKDGAWGDASWFVDDFCAGPGNVFYVHPDGSVAPCCGFANDNPALKIGTVNDTYDTLMENAAANTQVRACFDEGLGAVRKRLEAGGRRSPGKTRDICFFCDAALRRALAVEARSGYSTSILLASSHLKASP